MYGGYLDIRQVGADPNRGARHRGQSLLRVDHPPPHLRIQVRKFYSFLIRIKKMHLSVIRYKKCLKVCILGVYEVNVLVVDPRYINLPRC